MRVFILSSLFYFYTIVWAGGYQGCLERVYMYQAYLIDGLNAEDKQIMGWQCIGKKNWNGGTKSCKPSPPGSGWVRMPGYTPTTRLSYDKFIENFGEGLRGNSWSEPATGRLDIKATALKTYNVYIAGTPGQPPGAAKVKNVGANAFMKETIEWNDAIKKASKLVERTWKDKKDSLTDEQKALFKDFDEATKLVLEARIGDHGKNAIEASKAQLDPHGISTVTKKVGDNPISGGDAWETVDWKETIKQAEDAGIANARATIQAAQRQIYSGNSARDHKQVISSYRRAIDAKPNCGRA